MKYRTSKSLKISKRLRSLAVYKKAKVVMFFITHGSEVITKTMVANAWKEGKITAAPVVNEKETTMCAAKFSSFKKSLKKGAYGILEPDLNKCACVAEKDISLVLVPAVSFDSCGHRIGYGKGYYDKWLKSIPIARRVGLSYDFQVTDKLPFTKNDLKVSKVLTEKRIVNCK